MKQVLIAKIFMEPGNVQMWTVQHSDAVQLHQRQIRVPVWKY